MESEVAYGLKCMSNCKAAGPHGLMVEMFEALQDFGINRITKLANKIYDEGRFQPEMTKSVFINCTAQETCMVPPIASYFGRLV